MIRTNALRVLSLLLPVTVLLEVGLAALKMLAFPAFLTLFSMTFPAVYAIWCLIIEEDRSLLEFVPDVRAEYRALERYLARNENSILFSGSIFVTGSLILLGQSVNANGQMKTVVVVSAWAVYSIWLFFYQLLGYRIQNRAYQRLRIAEGILGFKAHEFLRSVRDPFRRWVWLVLLSALLGAGNGILGLELYLILASAVLPFGLILLLDDP